MALPSNISFGTVTGRFMRAVADGLDPDRDPDGIPLAGLIIRFTPSATVFKNVTASPGPVTIVADPIAVTTNEDGVLIGPDGIPGVRLVATDDPDLNPTGWTWRVSISGTGQTISFSFVLPTDATVDLTTLVPVPSNPGQGLEDWEVAVTRAEGAVSEALDAAATAQMWAGQAEGFQDAAVAELVSTDSLTQAAILTIAGGGLVEDPNDPGTYLIGG